MSKLYIKIDENNQAVDHPHLESNLMMLYPDHDFTSGPPSGWMEFVRVSPPQLSAYEKFDDDIGGDIANAFTHNGLKYEIVDGKFQDVWYRKDMNQEEKTAKQTEVKTEWANFIDGLAEDSEYRSYVFNEENCQYEAP